MADPVVQRIKFKRGTKVDLISQLTPTAAGVLTVGEPAFETDTGQLKIGDGVSSYAALPYVGGAGEDPRFVIQDPEANQVLLYDAGTQKWVNKDLSDNNSIVYLAEHGLTIKGYSAAKQGQMLVKDATAGLAWIDPLNDAALQAAVQQAANSATAAGISATNAGNSATAAATSAGTAQRINQQTVQWVNDKFWWGNLEEYNKLESITAGGFYFVRTED